MEASANYSIRSGGTFPTSGATSLPAFLLTLSSAGNYKHVLLFKDSHASER